MGRVMIVPWMRLDIAAAIKMQIRTETNATDASMFDNKQDANFYESWHLYLKLIFFARLVSRRV